MRLSPGGASRSLQTGRGIYNALAEQERRTDRHGYIEALRSAARASPMMACGRDATGPGLILMTKQGLYHQIISFIEIAVYLLLFFGILALHEAVVAAKDGIQFHFYGFAIVNALIFGKVILVELRRVV